MSRCSKLPIVGIVGCLLACSGGILLSNIPHTAYAVDEAMREEIVYRASFGRADDIKLLVDQGASPNQLNGNGTPIIAVAAVRSDPEAVNVIQMLVKLGANVNATDPKGQNALFYAAKAGNVDVVKCLLELKADTQALDANGDSVGTEATRAGHKDIIDVIDAFTQKQEHDRQVAEQAAEAAKAAEAATTPTTVSPPSPATSPADKSQSQKSESNNKLVAITDTKSKEVAEEKVKDATLATAKTPEALVAGEQAKEPFAIDEKKLEMDAYTQQKDAIAQMSKPPAPLTPEQQKQFDAIIKHGVDASEPATTEAANTTTPAEATATADKTPEQILSETAAKTEIDEKHRQEIKHLAYEVAYHTCSFQYWAYVMQVRQSSELASEELSIAIQTQNDAVESAQKKLVVDYHLPASFYDNITNSAQLRIYDQLNSLGTNRERHENGIGKMDDMENRCEEIGRQWGFPASYKINPPVTLGAPGVQGGTGGGSKPPAPKSKPQARPPVAAPNAAVQHRLYTRPQPRPNSNNPNNPNNTNNQNQNNGAVVMP